MPAFLWLAKRYEVCYPGEAWREHRMGGATCGPLAAVLIEPVFHGDARDT